MKTVQLPIAKCGSLKGKLPHTHTHTHAETLIHTHHVSVSLSLSLSIYIYICIYVAMPIYMNREAQNRCNKFNRCSE